MRHYLIAAAIASAFATIPASAATLLDAAVGDSVSVPGFRYASDKALTTEVTFKRIDVYAPHAKVIEMTSSGPRELPRDSRIHFVSDGMKTATRMSLSIDPGSRLVKGRVQDETGSFSIAGEVSGSGDLRISHTEFLESEYFGAHTCGGSPQAAPPSERMDDAFRRKTSADALAKGAGPTAVVAVETDNELLSLKFGFNGSNAGAATAAATEYLSDLFVNMNVMYERDLDLSMVQGDITLWTTATDPYSSGFGGASSAALSELGRHWRDNRSATDRAFVMQLSGKINETPSNGCSASGLAWLLNSGNYCANTGSPDSQASGHFSLTRVFTCPNVINNANPAIEVALDAAIVAHELGHNLGVRHTHCTAVSGASPTADVAVGTIDTCLRGSMSGDTGCYEGEALTCPTETFLGQPNQGTLMSYCGQFQGGAGCTGNSGQPLAIIHPTQQVFLEQRIADNADCLVAAAGDIGPTLSAQSPLSGTTTALGGGDVDAVVSGNITFAVAGGSGTGTTELACTVDSGTVTIASGTPQTIAVGGTAAAVVARFTLTDAAQTGVIDCTATPQGGTATDFTYTFTALAGNSSGGPAECTGDCVFLDGFEEQP